MAESAGIQKLSPKHEAMVQFLVENPTATRKEMASFFGVSVPWLSCILHSAAFQDKLAERQDELFASAVVLPLQQKVATAAHQTIDRINDRIGECADIKQLTETADKLLGRLGYGAGGANGSPVQNNFQFNFGPGQELYERARQVIGQGDDVAEGEARPQLEVGESHTPPALDLRQPAEVPRRQEGGSDLRGESTSPDGNEV